MVPVIRLVIAIVVLLLKVNNAIHVKIATMETAVNHVIVVNWAAGLKNVTKNMGYVTAKMALKEQNAKNARMVIMAKNVKNAIVTT